MRSMPSREALSPEDGAGYGGGGDNPPVMTATDRIEVNPAVMMGKPVIRGRRVPVELILRKLAEGATEADLLDAYPRLTADDLRAALAYSPDRRAQEER